MGLVGKIKVVGRAPLCSNDSIQNLMIKAYRFFRRVYMESPEHNGAYIYLLTNLHLQANFSNWTISARFFLD